VLLQGLRIPLKLVQKGGTSKLWIVRFLFVYCYCMFDPFASMPRVNRNMVYLGACLIAGIRLAREKQVNVRVVPTSAAIDESVELAQEIYCRVFRKVPQKIG